MKKEYCYDCGREQPIIIKNEQVEYEFRGQKYIIEEENHYCSGCANLLLRSDDDFAEKIYAMYHKDLKI